MLWYNKRFIPNWAEIIFPIVDWNRYGHQLQLNFRSRKRSITYRFSTRHVHQACVQPDHQNAVILAADGQFRCGFELGLYFFFFFKGIGVSNIEKERGNEDKNKRSLFPSRSIYGKACHGKVNAFHIKSTSLSIFVAEIL